MEAGVTRTSPGTKSRLAVQKLKHGGTEYLHLLWDYRILVMSGAILFGLSALLPIIPISKAGVDVCGSTMLCTHGGTPWGVVTSVFLYDGWPNIPVYFAVFLTYVSFSDRLEREERQRRARFASVVIFLSAFLANAIWVYILPLTYSWGPSGVVYALWGVLLAFTLFDGMPKQPKSLNPRTWYKDKKERSSAISNLAIFASTAIILSYQPAQFLSSGPGVNVFAHGVSFLGGYFAANAYRWRRNRAGLPQ